MTLNTGFSEINTNRLLYRGSNPWYLEVAITGRCNFKCKYCNTFDADLNLSLFEQFLSSVPPLQHIQLTGGEPTVHPEFQKIVTLCRDHSKVLGLSTNGSAELDMYSALPIDMFSISLDDWDEGILIERGYRNPAHIKNIIVELAKQKYVNIGLLLDKKNISRSERIIDYLLSLGINDVKISVSSHQVDLMPTLTKSYDGYPILSYRARNFRAKKPMRGFPARHCGIAKNDVTIVGDSHYPCLVYFREGGEPIGVVGRDLLKERRKWSEGHNCRKDIICSKFCMDFKCDFNAKLCL